MLRVDRTDTEPCDSIGSSTDRFDEPPPFQAAKKFQRAIGQHMTVARETIDFVYLAVLHAFEVDRATLSKNVQNTLFVL